MINLASFGIIVGLIFGGCCSNVYSLESIIIRHSDSGLLVTFTQFIMVILAALPLRFDIREKFYLRPTNAPARVLLANALLFFAVNALNNWAFAFNISIPVHIILRSFGSVATMVMGWIHGKRYTPIQVISVIILTFGVIIAAYADAISKGKSVTFNSEQVNSLSFESGLIILLAAQVLSAYMSVHVQETYAKYKPQWHENLFYSHLYGLPLFFFMKNSLIHQYTMISKSTPISLDAITIPVNKLSHLPIASNSLTWLINSIPRHILLLIMNAFTQFLCICGVNLLSMKTSAVTVAIVLNLRKLVSFLLSIYIFGNKLSGTMLSGAVLVFTSGILYTWETAARTSPSSKSSSKIKSN